MTEAVLKHLDGETLARLIVAHCHARADELTLEEAEAAAVAARVAASNANADLQVADTTLWLVRNRLKESDA